MSKHLYLCCHRIPSFFTSLNQISINALFYSMSVLYEETKNYIGLSLCINESLVYSHYVVSKMNKSVRWKSSWCIISFPIRIRSYLHGMFQVYKYLELTLSYEKIIPLSSWSNGNNGIRVLITIWAGKIWKPLSCLVPMTLR